MDIRNFFVCGNGTAAKKIRVDLQDPAKTSSSDLPCTTGPYSVTVQCSTSSSTLPSIQHEETLFDASFDLGQYISKIGVTDDEKYQMLTNPRVKFSSYAFKKDVLMKGKVRRVFQQDWLSKYAWLVYSPQLKGGLCKYCVLFKPALKRGTFGAFVVKAQQDFKHFHEDARAHEKNQWHIDATVNAKHFSDSIEMKQKSVAEQLDSAAAELVRSNRKKLKSIISTIIFCGTHDISLRGKHSHGGNFKDLLNFRVDAGDQVLENHLRTHGDRAKYTSHRVQNDLINICGKIIQENIVQEANNCEAFSLLADETADISGKEQLSVGIRYVQKDGDVTLKVKEEFLGFAELDVLNAEEITAAILRFTTNIGLDMEKLIGLGFDGCSTMAGHESGVQQRIREKYPKAIYFHCASHRLNLVVNDLNDVQEIRNSIGIVKQVIRFFRESILRRKTIPNIPLLCESRWSEKYKSIRIFSNNFMAIKEALCTLSTNPKVNQETRSLATQLDSATSTVKFIVCLSIISRYASYLEPVVNNLQKVDCDLHSVHKYVTTDLVKVFQKHRDKDTEEFSELFMEVTAICEKLDIDVKIPRLAERQKHRSNSNIQTSSPLDYFRINIFIPYLDSLLTSLNTRFGESNEIQLKAGILHPLRLRKEKKEVYIETIQSLVDFYNIENLEAEARIWYDMWKSKECGDNVKISDLLHDTTFFPAVRKMLVYYQTIPPTTCTVERSFSTLRRVKTWLRSMMSEDRLSNLCLLSVHRERVKGLNLEEKALNRFSESKRNIQFAFSEKY